MTYSEVKAFLYKDDQMIRMYKSIKNTALLNLTFICKKYTNSSGSIYFNFQNILVVIKYTELSNMKTL